MTVIPIDRSSGFRLVTNRDESPERPRATAPRWHDRVAGDRRAIWPVDGLAGGTWVAAGEHGLALTLLNANLETGAAPEPDRRLSRGGIIPRLIGSESAGDASSALVALELDRFEPFRLVAVDAADGVRIIESLWDGRSLSRVVWGAGPVCFASSGLGDRLVEARLPLFERMVVRAGASTEAQDAFHEHRWPDRAHVSVMMERPGARTVSVTRVEVRRLGAGRYEVAMAHEGVGAFGGPAVCPG